MAIPRPRIAFIGLLCLALGLPEMGLAELRISAVPGAGAGEVRLLWSGTPGAYYQVEATSDLALKFIPRSGILTENSGATEFRDTTARDAARFYRVREMDPDAGAYVLRAGVTNLVEMGRLGDFVEGMKGLGLYDHAVFIATLRSPQNAGQGATLFALRGSDATLVGAPDWGTNGVAFSGEPLRYVSFPNPLRTESLPALSLMCAFVSEQIPTGVLLGGCGPAPGFGPALLAGVSPHQGIGGTELFFDFTHDGSTPPAHYDVAGKRTFNYGNTGTWQVSLATFSTTNISLQTNIDRRYETAGAYPPLWNDQPQWRMGARLDDASRFVGTIAFVVVFDRALEASEADAVRRLYRASLGLSLPIPVPSFLVEGDSMCDEAQGYEFAMSLMHKPGWQGQFQKRNVAESAENLDDMLADYPTQVRPYAAEPGRKYLFLWGGRHNLTIPPPTVFALMSNYWRLARSDGFKVGALTITPATSDTPTLTSNRLAINAMIRAASDQYDYLIDVASLPELADPTDTGFYIGDGAHLSPAGFDVIADLIRSVLTSP